MTDTVHVTFFTDAYASTLKTADLTLEELRTRILTTSASTKATLPWLKLAIFGKKKNTKADGQEGKSLRHDGNVVQITGAELDYDGEQVGFDEALEMVKAMGISAIVYTSPSHTAAAPRWRILAPTSKPCPPKQRALFVARMNGFMKGILGKHVESFTLSQAYYYGQAKDNASANHMAVIVEGKPIDLCDHLLKYQDAGTIKDDVRASGIDGGSNPFENLANEQPERPKNTKGFDAILEEMGDGTGLKGFNDVLTRAVSNYVGLHNGNPFDHEKLKNLLRKAIYDAPKKPSRAQADIHRYLSEKYLNDIIISAIRKFSQEMPITLRDFVAYMPMHQYIFIPTRELWPAVSVNGLLPQVPRLDRQGRPILNKKSGAQRTEKPADWLDKNKAMHQMTWAPGYPQIIRDKLVDNGGWSIRKGTNSFNLYVPPTLTPGNANDVMPWTSHIENIYPEDKQHIINFLAHRVQFPGDKINHALLLGGEQGVGKDTILEPVKRAVGHANFQEISPANMLGRFNAYLRCVILRVSEVRDLGEVNRYAFYEFLKTITAAPPDVLRIDEKNLREHYIFNCCGVIMTTNHKTDGIYLPPGDRRTYVAWSNKTKEDFNPQYWNDLWTWYNNGGDANVMAYLQNLDLSSFNAKAPPPHTEAFKAIVSANHAPEQAELADALDALDNPDAITIDLLSYFSDDGFSTWLEDRKNRRAIPHRLEQNGYDAILNPDAKDGLWVVSQKRQRIYAKMMLSMNLKIRAAQELIRKIESGEMMSGKNAFQSTVHPFPPKGRK
jgi:hypothetical protein